MRGCLFVVILAAAVLVGGVWFGGPPLAGGVVAVGLAATGFRAAETTVDVVADPPLELLAGHADSVRIRARSATVEGLTAARVDLLLSDVDLLGRRAGVVAGELTGVRVGGADDPLAIDAVEVSGPASGATTVVTIPPASVEGVVALAIERTFGTRGASVRLVSPDRLSFALAGRQVEAVVSVGASGSLVASAPIGALELVPASAFRPLRVTNARVAGGALVLTGTLDLDALLR